jgi:hypothetical protein
MCFALVIAAKPLGRVVGALPPFDPSSARSLLSAAFFRSFVFNGFLSS